MVRDAGATQNSADSQPKDAGKINSTIPGCITRSCTDENCGKVIGLTALIAWRDKSVRQATQIVCSAALKEEEPRRLEDLFDED